jgi:hypothetical protein
MLEIDWGCGLSYTALAQQTQNPDFTPQYHPEN